MRSVRCPTLATAKDLRLTIPAGGWRHRMIGNRTADPHVRRTGGGFCAEKRGRTGRRAFIGSVVPAILMAPRAVRSQPARKPGEAPTAEKLRRVGMMTDRQDHLEALRQGLREFGWVEGRNVVIESRGTAGRFARLSEAAAELVRLKVDVIVCGGSESVQAAKAATRTIPIVMTFVGDPIGQGFIASFPRPGGTITGLSNLSSDLDRKRLELLKEVAPRITRIAVLWNPPQPAHAEALKNLELAARALGIPLQPIALTVSEDLDAAFAAIRREGAGAVTMLGSGLHVANFKRIAELSLTAKLPAVAWQRRFVDVGGLMMYGANEVALVRRSASYVDRILKGASPADLPVEQPTVFELVINANRQGAWPHDPAVSLGARGPDHRVMSTLE